MIRLILCVIWKRWLSVYYGGYGAVIFRIFWLMFFISDVDLLHYTCCVDSTGDLVRPVFF